MSKDKGSNSGWAVKLAAFIMVVVGLLLALIMIFTFMALGSVTQGEQQQNLGPVTGGPISEFGQGEIPAEMMPIYEEAAAKYKVPWNLLAAIHRVETRFSTIEPMLSYAGAEGHFQFMPCTWTGWSHPTCGGLGAGNIPASDKLNPAAIAQYGGFGKDGDGDGIADPYNIRDAAHASASYLAANGADAGNYKKAIFAYNHSEKYLADVTGFMQRFASGGSVSLTPGTGGFNQPLQTAITSRYGWRNHPIFKVPKLHGGIDFDCETGDPIPASKAGVVTHAAWQNINNPKAGLGQFVWVEHGGGLKTGYAHLSAMYVTVGQAVQAGQVVGACGNTGGSTGSHLHFEIYKNGVLTDPAPYLGL